MTEQEQQAQPTLDTLSAALEAGSLQQVRGMLDAMHPAEIGRLLESLPRTQRNLLWKLTDGSDDGEVLLYVNDEVRGELIGRTEHGDLVQAVEGLAVDDLADIIDDLPHAVTQELLAAMTAQDREFLAEVRAWPEDSAGGLMDTDLVTVRPNVTLEVVLRYLRMRGEIPDNTDVLFVLDRHSKYVGVLRLSDLLTQDPNLTVAEMLVTDVQGIPAETADTEVARLFENRDLVSAPVVNEEGRLVGRITIDDVVDVIRDEAEHSLLSRAGLDEEEDMFAPVWRSAQRRALWLGINLFTALLAAWVVGIFEATISEAVALAVLMPVVASMGGIAGSQTLTLVIRAQALGQISRANSRMLMQREMAVALINGIGWAGLVSAITLIWFQDSVLGWIIAVAILVNMCTAALCGFGIPLALKRFGIDPALAGSVVLTTVSDVVGFFAFLGLGATFLV